jgi:hypothetical protein
VRPNLRPFLAATAVLASLVMAPTAQATFSLTAKPSDRQVALDWPDVVTSGFYDVYRDGTWVKYLDTPTSAWTDTGLTNGRTYQYQVKAYRWTTGGGNTFVDQSNVVSGTPPGEGFGCFALSSLAAGARPPACWRPFSDSAPFNVGIPSAPKLHPNSSNIVAYMMSRGAPAQMQSNDGGYDWEHASYFAKSTDPVYTVHCRMSWGTCAPEGKQYRIPASAKPAGYLMNDPNADRHLAVVQPDGVTTLDLWQADTPSGTGGTLGASWGGLVQINGNGLNSGSTGANFSGFAGAIRGQQLEAGRINHALFAVTPCTYGYVYPANKGASECGATNAPPNGARLQLNMTSAEISALAVPQWKKVILEALRKYGMIIGDTGGGSIAFGLQFESGMVDRSFGRAEKVDQYAIAQGVPSWYDPAIGRTLHIFDLAPGVAWASRLRVIDPCVC